MCPNAAQAVANNDACAMGRRNTPSQLHAETCICMQVFACVGGAALSTVLENMEIHNKINKNFRLFIANSTYLCYFHAYLLNGCQYN